MFGGFVGATKVIGRWNTREGVLKRASEKRKEKHDTVHRQESIWLRLDGLNIVGIFVQRMAIP